MRAATVAAAALALASDAAAAAVDATQFRYVRELRSPAPRALRVFEPDGPLFAHARTDFGDLRIVTRRGEQVPWRFAPEPRPSAPVAARVLNSGRRGSAAVALLDLGPRRRVRDRVELVVPDRRFVGRAVVSGSDTRDGPFTRLGATAIYDVRGARRARSTTVVFPPADFRYLSLRATGVSRIVGATVSGLSAQPRLRVREHERLRIRQEGRRTIVLVDFGYARVPVDEIRVGAATGIYDRPVLVDGSNDGRTFVPLATGRLTRFRGSVQPPLTVDARHRYLRLTIENGDDGPLAGIRVDARARPREILVAPARLPLRVLYGAPALPPPSYDFARVPASALRAETAERAVLERETPNPRYEPPADTRSVFARNPGLVRLALALAALVVAAAGFLALRRHT